MRKQIWRVLVVTLMVLGGGFFAFKPAAAQEGTTVFFSPDPATIYLNGTNSQVVEVWVGNALNLYSFDIAFTYNPEIALISSWSFGEFFEIEVWACQRTTNNPGYFRLACTQIAPVTPKSGSGVVFRATFEGTQPGSTLMTLTKAEFSNTISEMIYAPLISGTLNVTYNSTIKPTTLSGSFDLQGRTNRGGVPVTLSAGQFVGQGPYTVSTTNVSGNNLSFTNVAMDLYAVSTAQAGYLNISPAMGKHIALLASGNVLPPLRLVGGNAIWTDNVINAQDLALVAGELGKSTFNADADINGNGKVDIFDLAMVAGNYGMTSEVAYAGWTP